jgi:hypothetical protein
LLYAWAVASIESLPPDQRAVLELVLERGRSYDQIAQLLSIDRAAVRQRALAALDALGPPTRVPPERRALITDYLLGALPQSVAEEVREHLAQSASERAWARVVASELHGLARDPLPEVPAEGRATRDVGDGAADAQVAAREPEPAVAPAAAAREPQPAAAAAPAAPDAQQAASPPAARGPRRSSRLGGAVLLGGGAAVVVAVVLVLILSGGGGSTHAPNAARPASTTGRTSPTSSTTPQLVSRINLKPPSGANKPLGIAEVLREKGNLGVAIVAAGLAANSKRPPNAYAVWLYNSPSDSHILGFVSPAVGKNGQLQTAGGLPSNAHHYQKLLLTLETQSKPRTPGPIILEGALTGV